VTAFVTAGAGFLLAVLWFDLIFDSQVRRHAGDQYLPEAALASIAAYYRRATTEAHPMNLLVAAVMAGTLAALVAQLAGDGVDDWVAMFSLVLAAGAIGIAGISTVPNARRLGARRDPLAVQSGLARAIYRDHVVCLVLIVAVLAIELGFGT
jgi:hypothetical protein